MTVRTSDLGIGCKSYYPMTQEEQDLAFAVMQECPNMQKKTCRCHLVRPMVVPAPVQKGSKGWF
jgi:Fe-S-cluster containining protein